MTDAWEFTVPIRTVSESNQREHWAVRNRRAKEQRDWIQAGMAYEGPVDWIERGTAWPANADKVNGASWDISLTRIAPRTLDGDNLQNAFKHCRDQIALDLGFGKRVGQGDADPRLTWHYAQARGKPKEYAVRVRIERRGEVVTNKESA